MISFSLCNMALILNAKHVGGDCIIDTVSIHSKCIDKKCMFIALIGKNFDGHIFAEQAMIFGAKALLVNHYLLLDIPQLIVNDTNFALMQLAGWVSHNVSAKLIMITGSSGKTSVKEMTASILRSCGRVIATECNFNNKIGVPITLSRLTEKDNFAVIEVGASSIGEIDQMSQIFSSHTALVNNIYPSHLLGFRSLDILGTEKGKIFLGLFKDGISVINDDSHAISLWCKLLIGKVVWRFSISKKSDIKFFASGIFFDKSRIRFTLHTPCGSASVSLSMLGIHNISNALAASALAFSVGAELSEIVAGLENTKILSGRLCPIILGKRKFLVDDTYNSNVGSVIAAIYVLNTMPGYRILVMSDMADLGEYYTVKYHCYIGQLIAKSNIDEVLTIGNISYFINRFSKKKGNNFYNKSKLIFYLKKVLFQHESISILIKGSRIFHMEKVVQSIRDIPICCCG